MSRRVFISYEYTKDQEFVNGIKGMLANPNIDVDFYNESIIEPINSINAGYIKQKIKEKISRVSLVLCIVGQDTHSSEWVAWEVKTAIDLGKEVFFMRRKDNYTSRMPVSVLSNLKIYDWDLDWLKKL